MDLFTSVLVFSVYAPCSLNSVSDAHLYLLGLSAKVPLFSASSYLEMTPLPVTTAAS